MGGCRHKGHCLSHLWCWNIISEFPELVSNKDLLPRIIWGCKTSPSLVQKQRNLGMSLCSRLHSPWQVSSEAVLTVLWGRQRGRVLTGQAQYLFTWPATTILNCVIYGTSAYGPLSWGIECSCFAMGTLVWSTGCKASAGWTYEQVKLNKVQRWRKTFRFYFISRFYFYFLRIINGFWQ